MRNKIRIVLNILIAAIVFAAWISMFLSGEGRLSSAGFASLKYFTVLSNLLAGAAAAVWLRSRGERAEVLKYVATVAVAITFAVTAFFLGAIYGHAVLYKGANLWLHLIVPVLCMAEQLFLPGKLLSARENLLVIVPVVLYGTGYLVNIILNGVGEWPDTNDWYGFVLWGLPVGIVIFAGICLTAWLLGLLFRKAGRRFYREET